MNFLTFHVACFDDVFVLSRLRAMTKCLPTILQLLSFDEALGPGGLCCRGQLLLLLPPLKAVYEES